MNGDLYRVHYNRFGSADTYEESVRRVRQRNADRRDQGRTRRQSQERRLAPGTLPDVPRQNEGAGRQLATQGRVDTFEVAEVVELRTTNATMREELARLYATVAELRKRLARYELAPWEKLEV